MPARVRIGVIAAALACFAAPALAQPQKRKRLPEREIKAATAVLVGEDRDAARKAAATLGSATNRTATAPLIDALASGLAPEVGLAALEALEVRGDARALDVLAIYARHRRPRHRAAALSALGAIRDRRGAAAIVAGLSDPVLAVRRAAANAIARQKIKSGIKPLLALLERGDPAAPAALAKMADAALVDEIAKRSGGETPDAVIAECLGAVLARADFGPDAARLVVVKALGQIPDPSAIEVLATYVANTPEKPPRPSRAEAERLLGERL